MQACRREHKCSGAKVVHIIARPVGAWSHLAGDADLVGDGSADIRRVLLQRGREAAAAVLLLVKVRDLHAQHRGEGEAARIAGDERAEGAEAPHLHDCEDERPHCDGHEDQAPHPDAAAHLVHGEEEGLDDAGEGQGEAGHDPADDRRRHLRTKHGRRKGE